MMELYSSYNVFIAWTGKILAFFFLTLVISPVVPKSITLGHAPAALPPGKRPGTQRAGGWVGPRDGLDGCRRSRLHWNSILGPSSLWRVAIPTTMSWPLQTNISGIYSFPLIRCLYDFLWKADNIPRRSLHSNVHECIYLFPLITIVSYYKPWSIFNFFSTSRLLWKLNQIYYIVFIVQISNSFMSSTI